MSWNFNGVLNGNSLKAKDVEIFFQMIVGNSYSFFWEQFIYSFSPFPNWVGDISIRHQKERLHLATQLDFPWNCCSLFLLWMHFFFNKPLFLVSSDHRLSIAAFWCLPTTHLFDPAVTNQIVWLPSLKKCSQ